MADYYEKRRSLGKRPLSAFLMFCCEKRKEIHKEKMSLSDSTRILSQQWKTMTDEEKEPFIKQSTKDKERYHKQLKENPQLFPSVKRREKSSKKERKSRAIDSRGKRGRPRVARIGVVDGTNDVTAAAAVHRPSSSNLQNAYLQGVNIPIFTEEFLQYNRKGNSDLMKYRQVNNHLIDQKQRLEDTIQAIDSDIDRVIKLVEERAQSNQTLEMELQVIRKLVSNALAPNNSSNLLTSEELLDQAIRKGDSNDVKQLTEEVCKHYSN